VDTCRRVIAAKFPDMIGKLTGFNMINEGKERKEEVKGRKKSMKQE
jgi:hypothetical protein